MTWDVAATRFLAHVAWDGFWILGLGCLAVYFCKQPIRRLRIIELALAGALLVPCSSLIAGFPHLSLGWLRGVSQPAEASLPSEPFVATDQVPASGSVPPTLASQPATVASADLPVTVRVPLTPEQSVVQPTTASASTGRATSGSTFSWIVVTYLLGATLVGSWWLLGVLQLARIILTATPAVPEVSDLFERIAGPGGRRVRILTSTRIRLPLTVTLWRPYVILPATGGVDDPTLRYCLAHEWSHIEGHDSFRWHLTSLVQAIFFFLPCSWWLRTQVRLCQDYLADARARQEAQEPADYAEFLVTLARQNLAANTTVALGIADRRSNLYRRVQMLLERNDSLERRPPGRWTIGLLAAAAVVLGGTALVRLDAQAAGDDTKTTAKQNDTKKTETPPISQETLHYSGKVTDKDTAKGIVGATVTVRRSLLGDPAEKEYNRVVAETKHTTDAEGKYNFTIPPDQVAKGHLYIELDVEAPGYAPRKHFGYALSMILKNEKLGGRPFFENVDLRPAKEIAGILKTPEGKPATGVKVMAYSNTDKKSEMFEYGSFADSICDAEGRFRIWVVTPGPAYVWLLPTDYVPETHVLKNDKRGDLGTFTLHDGPRIRGKVFDAQGKPIPGLNVNAESQDRNEEITLPVADQINRSAVTNDQGEFVMGPLPPGHYVVKPDEHSRETGKTKKPAASFEGVFAGKKLTLNEESAAKPLEVRASPHVVIEVQCLDSAEKPSGGHEFMIFGRLDGVSWFGQAKLEGGKGHFVARIPHGLESVQLDLMTNEHGALRWRRGDKGELHNNRRVDLGTVNEDIKDLQMIRYKAPILLVTLKGPGGAKLEKPNISATYTTGKGAYGEGVTFVSGARGDVNFEHQEDGRFRSEQMFPDQEVKVVGQAAGYVSKPQIIKLAEGATKEIEVQLEKAEQK